MLAEAWAPTNFTGLPVLQETVEMTRRSRTSDSWLLGFSNYGRMTRGIAVAGESTKCSPGFPVLHTKKVRPRNLRVVGWAAPDACKDPFLVTTQVHNRTVKVEVRLKNMSLNSRYPLLTSQRLPRRNHSEILTSCFPRKGGQKTNVCVSRGIREPLPPPSAWPSGRGG